VDAQKNMVAQMLSLAEMEKREALRLCQKYNEEDRKIKDNDGKVIAKSTQTTVCLELENNICWTKKIQEDFPSSRNRNQQKAKKL
jgi:hypothetical protein